MSKYTSQLRWIVEQLGNGLDVPEGQQYADAVYKYIGLNEYPIFNEDYRVTLNDMIINHYYFREIGFETAAQFAWYLKRTMREIMPKYNMMYNALLMFEENGDNPLADYTRHRTEDWNIGVDSTSNTESENTTSSETDFRNVYQDTPMSLLSNSGSPSVENLDYATNVTYNDDDTTSTSNTESTNDAERDEEGNRVINEYGRNKSLAALVKEFNESFTNIDLLIIEDILDSGRTLSYIKEMLLTRKPKSIKICTLFDKPERRQVDLFADYIGCEVPNEFIVGYGLDYNELYRNLPYIAEYGE